jgi:hypothetical protein
MLFAAACTPPPQTPPLQRHTQSAMLRGQLQHHQLAGPHTPTAGGPDQVAALAEYMKSQQAQGGASQVCSTNT